MKYLLLSILIFFCVETNAQRQPVLIRSLRIGDTFYKTLKSDEALVFLDASQYTCLYRTQRDSLYFTENADPNTEVFIAFKSPDQNCQEYKRAEAINFAEWMLKNKILPAGFSGYWRRKDNVMKSTIRWYEAYLSDPERK